MECPQFCSFSVRFQRRDLDRVTLRLLLPR